MLDQFPVLHKQNASVDVKDFALSVLAAILLDIIIVSNFGSVTIRSYSVPVSTCDLRNLSVQECAYVAPLVQDLQDLTVNPNHATDR